MEHIAWSGIHLNSAATITLVVLGLILLWFLTKSTNRVQQLNDCRRDLEQMMIKQNCQPLLLRLAWSDAVTFDQSVKVWPKCGGVNGSIRFPEEYDHPYNGGLLKALQYLKPIHKKYRSISHADIIQMAGALAVETCGGPKLLDKMLFGRVDAPSYNSVYSSTFAGRQRGSEVYRMPTAEPPFPDAASSPEIHVRSTFTRLGFSSRETVALCGAHTVGRSFHDRTGLCPFSSGDAGATPYTAQTCRAKGEDGPAGIGMAGGCSWTKNWLQFDNSYFTRPDLAAGPEHRDKCLLWFSTDEALRTAPEYRPHFQRYASDQRVFFLDYAAAHKKMSELGAKFDPPQGLRLISIA